MSTKVTREEIIGKIKDIIENEKFRLDGFFLCGFPTGAPNQVLQKACEKYIEIEEKGQPSEADTKTLIEALEDSLKVESEYQENWDTVIEVKPEKRTIIQKIVNRLKLYTTRFKSLI